ncbi:hypothetical protein PG984_006763 [Apiospora sp. TS-2023a]
MEITIPDDSPWHGLSSQQRQTIKELTITHGVNCACRFSNSRLCFHARIVNLVFYEWNAEEKPDVPIVNHPHLKEFSFALECTKESQPVDPPGQEIERPCKIRRTTGVDTASQGTTIDRCSRVTLLMALSQVPKRST